MMTIYFLCWKSNFYSQICFKLIWLCSHKLYHTKVMFFQGRNGQHGQLFEIWPEMSPLKFRFFGRNLTSLTLIGCKSSAPQCHVPGTVPLCPVEFRDLIFCSSYVKISYSTASDWVRNGIYLIEQLSWVVVRSDSYRRTIFAIRPCGSIVGVGPFYNEDVISELGEGLLKRLI